MPWYSFNLLRTGRLKSLSLSFHLGSCYLDLGVTNCQVTKENRNGLDKSEYETIKSTVKILLDLDGLRMLKRLCLNLQHPFITLILSYCTCRWGGGGSSPDACEEIYCGTRPFSESEALAVARYLYKLRKNLVSFMDIHTYGQLWMSPWGFTEGFPRDFNRQVHNSFPLSVPNIFWKITSLDRWKISVWVPPPRSTSTF